jgi:aspartyl-tRNA(Asn)/glutamyl-tRNA(Gln) amidotransferase subunit A
MSADDLSISALGAGYRDGSLSPVEATRAALQRIAAFDGRLNSFIAVLEGASLAAAEAAARELAAGHDRGPLHGVPVAIKDLIAMAGVATTFASRAGSPTMPAADAVLVARLRQAGAIIIGKTNLLEYAYGAVHPAYGQTNNPWNLARTSGGSSGGSAAAVAAGFCAGAVGTDTGGSIRIPAAYRGVVGLKPSFGLIDLAGVQPLSWSLDHAGPIARSCTDAGFLVAAMTGRPCPVAPRGFRGLRLGVMRHPGAERFLQPDVAALFDQALKRFAGAEIRPVEIDDLELAADALLTILEPEASVIHRRLIAAEPTGYAETTRLQIEAGFAIPATAYIRAQQLQRTLAERFRRLFETVDPILSPAVAWVAPAEDPALNADGGAGEMLYSAVYNLVGLPAVSIPCGLRPPACPRDCRSRHPGGPMCWRFRSAQPSRRACHRCSRPSRRHPIALNRYRRPSWSDLLPAIRALRPHSRRRHGRVKPTAVRFMMKGRRVGAGVSRAAGAAEDFGVERRLFDA